VDLREGLVHAGVQVLLSAGGLQLEYDARFASHQGPEEHIHPALSFRGFDLHPVSAGQGMDQGHDHSFVCSLAEVQVAGSGHYPGESPFHGRGILLDQRFVEEDEVAHIHRIHAVHHPADQPLHLLVRDRDLEQLVPMDPELPRGHRVEVSRHDHQAVEGFSGFSDRLVREGVHELRFHRSAGNQLHDVRVVLGGYAFQEVFDEDVPPALNPVGVFSAVLGYEVHDAVWIVDLGIAEAVSVVPFLGEIEPVGETEIREDPPDIRFRESESFVRLLGENVVDYYIVES